MRLAAEEQCTLSLLDFRENTLVDKSDAGHCLRQYRGASAPFGSFAIVESVHHLKKGSI